MLSGRYGRKRAGDGERIDWVASLHQGRPRHRQALVLRPASAQAPKLWLIVLDASASTRRQGALSQAKGLLAALFKHAYQQRVRLAVLSLSQGRSQWLVQGQRPNPKLQQWLAEQGAGGGTPLLESLREAQTWLVQRQKLKPAELQQAFIVTDGRLRVLPPLLPFPCPTMVVDIELTSVRLGRASLLAKALGAEYCSLESLELMN